MWYNEVMKVYDLVSELVRVDSAGRLRAVEGSALFDQSIMGFRQDAEEVWRSVSQRFAEKEDQYGLLFRFDEAPKLYALDAFLIAQPLLKDADKLKLLAEFFVAFYLGVHYIDDHIEHRDKFYSKFRVSGLDSIDTQRGAMPFSFMLIISDIIHDVLSELGLDEAAINTMLRKVRSVYLNEIRYFTPEKRRDLTADEVLEMKQRQITGQCLLPICDLLHALDSSALSDKEWEKLRKGIVRLGSLTQITDDIRDESIDAILGNANLLIVLKGDAEALAAIYQAEQQEMIECLRGIYDNHAIDALVSLPLYPFTIKKRGQRR